MPIYTVRRSHLGDRLYRPGETRSAMAADVAHLVRAGVLAEKAEPVALNTSEPAPANKAERAPKNKAG